jgi:hypothetical protein
MSNFYCLPGRAGGTPNVLEGTDFYARMAIFAAIDARIFFALRKFPSIGLLSVFGEALAGGGDKPARDCLSSSRSSA